ncbi:MAG: ribonuclease P protein component [Planctomycetota bacterium]|jgi:ribonuclease P protein component
MSEAPDQSFPPTNRLHTRRDYGRVFHRCQRADGKHCGVQLAARPKRGGKRARLGIVVGTKVHKRAVRRHQLKRWVRELFRREYKELLHGFDCVVMFRRDPPTDGHAALDDEIRRLISKAMAAEPRQRQPRRR